MSQPPEPLVHIVDDDEAVRGSLKLLLYSVRLACETYASAADFLERCDFDRPGCLIADVRMPAMSGLDLQRLLRDRGIRMPVILLTAHGDVPMAVRALKAGASDFLEKPYDDQQLIDSVHHALADADRAHRERERMAQARACYEQLTAREREIVGMVAAGDASKLIAARLGISQRTVEAHRANVMAKFRARTLSDLVRMTQLLE